MSELDPAVRDTLETLPAEPGCYVFRDKKGTIVYIGKARSLRSRVRQYFQPGTSDYRYFVPLLERVLGSIDTIVTANEKEAVILENALIKQHRPRFNVKLRDDKDYLSIRIDKKVPFPRLEIVRRPQSDGAAYFGPYPSSTAARRTLHTVNKYFKLRTCDDVTMGSRTRPCLEYQIKRCPGPCVLPVASSDYAQQVRYVELFLEGRRSELTEQIEGEMRVASKDLAFERAATLRDQLTALRAVQERQRVAEVSDADRDVFGMYREGDSLVVTTLIVRAGFVRDTMVESFTQTEVPDDEIIAAVISQRYALGEDPDALHNARIPDEVVVPVLPEAAEGMAAVLTERRGRKVEISVPSRGARSKLLALANDNARHSFRERRLVEKTAEDHSLALQERLGLQVPPRVIECLDISHHQGGDTVGAVVSLRDGVPNKTQYRGYHVASEHSGNDYAAMLEVLTRRFRRGRDEEKGWDLPDLFVVDGGRGQLGVAVAVLQDLGITGLQVCSLAKERENVAGEKLVDRVYLPGRKNPIPIDRHAAALVLLARARDEAHRFANVTREKLHHRVRIHSEIDEVPGVGSRSRIALLKTFGSVEGIRNASLDEIRRVAGMTDARARAVFEHFHPPG